VKGEGNRERGKGRRIRTRTWEFIRAWASARERGGFGGIGGRAMSRAIWIGSDLHSQSDVTNPKSKSASGFYSPPSFLPKQTSSFLSATFERGRTHT
jgi:hypothetical protein